VLRYVSAAPVVPYLAQLVLAATPLGIVRYEHDAPRIPNADAGDERVEHAAHLVVGVVVLRKMESPDRAELLVLVVVMHAAVTPRRLVVAALAAVAAALGSSLAPRVFHQVVRYSCLRNGT